MINLFESSNWKDTKGQLFEGLSDDKKALLEQCLENTRNFVCGGQSTSGLYEDADASVSSASGVTPYYKMILPILRRVIPGTIANELVGVSPMDSPVGLIPTLRFSYADALDVAGTANDISVGDEVFGSTTAGVKTSRYFTGSTAAGLTDGSGADLAGSEGSGYLTTAAEGSLGRRMKISLLNQQVKAKSRRVKAEFSVEAAQDARAMYSLNIEAETTSIMSSTILTEIDNEIINDLKLLAGTVKNIDMTTVGLDPSTGANLGYGWSFTGDKMSVIGLTVDEVANDIAVKTRRGPGNFIVITPRMVTAFKNMAKGVFQTAAQGAEKFKSPTGTEFIGTLNGSIKVYSYVYGAYADGFGATTNTEVLIGYKGTEKSDTGYHYCPFVPLYSTGVITHPETGIQHIGLLTRYGKAYFNQTATSLGNSADYYGRINVTNLSYTG